MKSMTGYGKGAVLKYGYEITVELKSVNHRFSDLNIKSPKVLSFGDDIIRKEIQKRISRGHIDIYVNFFDRRENGSVFSLNKDIASGLLFLNEQIRTLYRLQDDMTTSRLMKFPEVYSEDIKESDTEKLAEILKEALCSAIDGLDSMREAEGNCLKEKLKDILFKISEFTDEIAERAPKVKDIYKQKLTERISAALGEVEIDQARLLNEVAFFVDRSDIDEEVTRLRSHLAQFSDIINEDMAVGKKMDFLVQEMNREANTIGSKANDLEISNFVVNLKNEIEKLREQIQNIE